MQRGWGGGALRGVRGEGGGVGEDEGVKQRSGQLGRRSKARLTLLLLVRCTARQSWSMQRVQGFPVDAVAATSGRDQIGLDWGWGLGVDSGGMLRVVAARGQPAQWAGC